MSHTRTEFTGTPDADLIRLVQGSPATPAARRAAGELLHRHQDAIYVWCFKYAGDRDRALDLAQDVLLNAYRSIVSFEWRSEFSSWLFSIVRNRCLSEARRSSVFIDAEPNPDITTDRRAIRPDHQLEYEETEQWVRDLIEQRLDTQEQDVVCLRCFEGMPLDEIARVVAVESAEDVRVILQRARRKLRAGAEKEKRGQRIRKLWKETASE